MVYFVRKQIPNIITISRIVVIPFFVAAFFIADEKLLNITVATLFLIAGFSDYFDGYFARKWNVQSQVGKFLDPIADKLLVLAALIMLIYIGRADVIAALIILIREITVSGLREFLGQNNVTLPVSELAKWKTAIQMLAIMILIIGPEFGSHSNTLLIGNSGLWIAAALTWITGYTYLKSGLNVILKPQEK